jgi:hypothetical protein
MMATEPRPILAKHLHNALVEAGVLQRDELVTRVVIDAQHDNWVKVYVERVADTRLLTVVPTLDGVEISSAPRPEGESTDA